MQLLGNYPSTLTNSHYQQLVALLQQAIQAGDFGGGEAFDQAALEALRKQAQDFSTLPVPSAGQVVTDESFNRPITLLAAQFAALLAESETFNDKLASLLSILDKDTSLIDQLLAQAALQQWISTIPSLTGSSSVAWDFGVGYGPVPDTSLASLWMDPANNVSYTSRPSLVSQMVGASIHTGMAPVTTRMESPVNNLRWTYEAGDSQVETLNQGSWTKLTLLDPAPRLNYAASPVVTPAASPFLIAGISNLGSLPVYVQTSFLPRIRVRLFSAANGVPISLSPYTVDTDQVRAFVGSDFKGQYLSKGTDYTVDEFGIFTPLTLSGPAQISIVFVEEFPAYQCSIDQVRWSRALMLDPARSFPDASTDFEPVPFVEDQNGAQQMPVTDDLGNPTGLYIQILTAPREMYLLQAYSQASPETVGATAVLEADFARMAFLVAIRMTPFTTFPMVLKKVEVQGVSSNTRKSVWEGSVVIDRPTSIGLDSAATGVATLVSKAFFTFYQPNYSLKQQTVPLADALRRNVMAKLQSILPFDARAITPASPQTCTGAQYEFGIEDVVGESFTPQAGLIVSGPRRISGCPELFRFDASVFSIPGAPAVNSLVGSAPASPVDFFLCYRAYDVAGTVQDENLVGVQITSGQSGAFPFSGSLVLSTVDHVDVYLKVVPRSQALVVERYLLQVTTR